MPRRVILLALLVSACNTVGTDRNPPGSDHAVDVLLNEGKRFPVGEPMFQEMDRRAMAKATERCQGDGQPVVVVLRKVYGSVNQMTMTYRCAPR